jgi:hypothetical protein
MRFALLREEMSMRHSALSSLVVAFCVLPRLWSQVSTSTVQRDQQALTLLSQSIAAMTASPSAQLRDLIAEGTCTQWNGADESASVTYSLIRDTASHFEVHLPESTPSWTINAGRGFSIDKDGQRHLMHLKNAAKGNWYIPVTYILQAINDPNVSVSIESNDQTALSNEDTVVLTSAPVPGSALIKDYTTATRHIVHLDHSTHLVTEVDDRVPLVNGLNSSIPHSLHYSDFREESGWLLPHSVEEYFGQSRAHAFTFSHFTINSKLSPASFAVSQ